MSEPLADDQIELVIFTVAGIRYAADLTQVRRIDSPNPDDSVGAPLGHTQIGHRALVFDTQGGERRLHVDQVQGVQRVPKGALRRMPKAAAAPPMSIGAWIDGDTPVVLIDLVSLIQAA